MRSKGRLRRRARAVQEGSMYRAWRLFWPVRGWRERERVEDGEMEREEEEEGMRVAKKRQSRLSRVNLSIAPPT